MTNLKQTTDCKKTIGLRRKNLKNNLFVLSIVAYPLILFCVFWVGVNFNSLIMAFQEIGIDAEIGRYTKFIGLENFKAFISMMFQKSGTLAISFKNSTIMYLVGLLLCLPLQVLFSYLIFKKCKLHRVLRSVIMIPQIMSSFVICLLFKKFIDYNGALPAIIRKIFPDAVIPNFLRDPSTAFGTVLFYMIWNGFGTSIIMFSNAMKEVSGDILESAQVDGVQGMFQELIYIVLPLIYPTLTTFIITGFAGFLVVAGPNVEFYMYDAPMEAFNVGYFYIRQTMIQSETYYPVLAAGGLLMTLVIAPFTHLLKKLLDKFDPQGENA